MRVLSLVASVAVWVAACGAAARTDPASLDLRGAVQYALDHNRDIASRQATLASDEATYAKDHANEYPPVTGTAQNTLAKQSNASAGPLEQFGVESASTTTYSQNLAQIGSQWTIYNGSYNQILAQRAKRQVESDRADLRRAQQQLVATVSDAYYTVSVRSENVALDAADEAFQESLLTVARDNERVGRSAGVDTLRAQVNALRARASLVSATADEANARETLAQQIGASPDQPFTFTSELPEPPITTLPLATLIATAESNRSDIGAASAALANARLGNSIIDTDRFPVLQVNAAFGNQFSPTQNAEEMNPITGAAIPLPRGNPGFWQIGATESLQIGLIDYGARHAQHRAAHQAISAAQAALDSTRYAVETDVRQALRGAQTAQANLATAKEASMLGAESARIAQLQYKNGLTSLTDATQAERDNLSAQNDLVNARVNYIDAIVRLRVSVGASDPVAIVDFRNP
jgi:outer membrane protein TolC